MKFITKLNKIYYNNYSNKRYRKYITNKNEWYVLILNRIAYSLFRGRPKKSQLELILIGLALFSVLLAVVDTVMLLWFCGCSWENLLNELMDSLLFLVKVFITVKYYSAMEAARCMLIEIKMTRLIYFQNLVVHQRKRRKIRLHHCKFHQSIW